MIHVGDCIDILKTLEPNSYDLIFADPPYNLGVDYGEGRRGDYRKRKEYLEWSDQWLYECHRLLSGRGSIWVLINQPNIEIIDSGLHEHFWLRNRIVWYESFSTYNSSESNFTCEYRNLLYFVKDYKDYLWFPDAIRVESQRQKMGDKRANPKGRVPGNVWEVSRLCGTFNERVDWHPCQLPQAPLTRILRACLPPVSEQVCNVLEIFSGSGSFGVATKQEGHNYTGIEKNPEYARKTQERIEAYMPQLNLKGLER